MVISGGGNEGRTRTRPASDADFLPLIYSPMAEEARIELAYPKLDRHLSRVLRYHYSILPLEPTRGFEPRLVVLETTVLPLNDVDLYGGP